MQSATSQSERLAQAQLLQAFQDEENSIDRRLCESRLAEFAGNQKMQQQALEYEQRMQREFENKLLGHELKMKEFQRQVQEAHAEFSSRDSQLSDREAQLKEFEKKLALRQQSMELELQEQSRAAAAEAQRQALAAKAEFAKELEFQREQ